MEEGTVVTRTAGHLPHALLLHSHHQQAALHFLILSPLWLPHHLPLMCGKILHLVWSPLRHLHCHLEHTNWSLVLSFTEIYPELLFTPGFAATMKKTSSDLRLYSLHQRSVGTNRVTRGQLLLQFIMPHTLKWKCEANCTRNGNLPLSNCCLWNRTM